MSVAQGRQTDGSLWGPTSEGDTEFILIHSAFVDQLLCSGHQATEMNKYQTLSQKWFSQAFLTQPYKRGFRASWNCKHDFVFMLIWSKRVHNIYHNPKVSVSLNRIRRQSRNNMLRRGLKLTTFTSLAPEANEVGKLVNTEYNSLFRKFSYGKSNNAPSVELTHRTMLSCVEPPLQCTAPSV